MNSEFNKQNNEFNVENNNYASEEDNLNQFNMEDINLNNSNINNQNSNNKNDKWKDILIFVLVIIVFILTALSLYFVIDMKNNDLDSNKDNNQQENENSNVQEESDKNTDQEQNGNLNDDFEPNLLKIDETKDIYYVVDGKEYDVYLNGDLKETRSISFDYPIININTESVKKLNEEIRNLYESRENSDVTHQDIPTGCSTCLKLENGYSCSMIISGLTYNVEKEKDLLKVSIIDDGHTACSSGIAYINKYLISLVDGNVLTEQDIFNYLGYNRNEMISKLRNYLVNIYDTIEDKHFNDIVDNLEFDIKNNNLLVSWNLGCFGSCIGDLVYDGFHLEENIH